MKKLRSATVESVLGTLLDFRAMRKVHTRGIKFANKHGLLATMAYNLKKLMNHVYYKFSISIANVINNWLDYMKSVTIFNFDKINQAKKTAKRDFSPWMRMVMDSRNIFPADDRGGRGLTGLRRTFPAAFRQRCASTCFFYGQGHGIAGM
mgnify:CR=1 FL=1